MAETHELKCWPGPFAEVLSGQKRHEVRVFDRAYAPCDRVILREWDTARQTYTGREQRFRIGHVSLPGTWGLPDGLCVFSLLDDCKGTAS